MGPLKPWSGPGPDPLPGGVPMHPLKPGSSPGWTQLSGGVPMHPRDEYLHPKGAAASAPPPFGISVCLQGALGHPLELGSSPGWTKVSGGALGHPLEVGPGPGQTKVSGGPRGCHQKRTYIPECGKVSGVCICNCSIISCIMNEDKQKT